MEPPTSTNGVVKNIKTFKPPLKETDTRLENTNVYFNEYALKGIVEETPTSQIFFSKANMDLIQKTIRYDIFQKLKQVIDYQSYNALFVIMRSIYLQNGDSGVASLDIANQIRVLNKMVIDYAVNEQILPNLKQYGGYIQKIGTLPVPLERSRNESIKGTKTYDISNLL
jgi:hypothetical protein